MKSTKPFQLSLLAAVLLFGCRGNHLTSNQLIGAWQWAPKSRLDAKVQGAVPELNLASNGTFTANSLPPDFARGLSDDQQPISGTGSWQIKEFHEDTRVMLTFKSVQGNQHRPLPYGAELFPDSSSSGVRLYYFEADPDDSPRIYLTRTQDNRLQPSPRLLPHQST